MAENLSRAEKTGGDGSLAMGADYIPEKNNQAAVWLKHFAAQLVATPELYRTTPEDAAEIDALVQTFRVANATAGRPATRTSVAIQARDDARKAAERMLRPAAKRINSDPRIASDLKVAIGLKPRKKRRHRIDPSESVPVLNPQADMTGGIHIRVHDSQRGRRARPKWAAGLELYERIIPRDAANGAPAIDASTVANGGAEVVPPGWRFIGNYTRTPIVVYPAANATGDAVYYQARWFTRRGAPGRFSDPRTVNAIYNAGVRPSALQLNRRRAA
jgi:hypothetical protein